MRADKKRLPKRLGVAQPGEWSLRFPSVPAVITILGNQSQMELCHEKTGGGGGGVD